MIGGRWVVVGAAIALWMAVLIAWIGDDPRLSDFAYAPFSSYNTSVGGTSNAFAYLAARRAGVRRLFRPIALERPPREATIFRLGAARRAFTEFVIADEKKGERTKKPADEKKKKKTSDKKKDDEREYARAEKLLDDDEENWVRSGGRLVIAPSSEYGRVHLELAKCSDLRRVFPVEPPLPKPDVPTCHAMSGAGLQRFHSLVAADSGAVVATWKLGAGDVILFSIPEAFSNEFIAKPGNAALLERLGGDRRTIYFDEMIHGIEDESSIWDLLVGDWRLGPSIFVFAIAAVAAFWRKARRTGPPEREDRDTRSEAVDLVQSMGQLYDRALDREESLRLYYHGLVRAVHGRTGLKGEALEHFVRERTEGYDPSPRFQDITREEFQRMLKILNHAYETVGYANPR